MIMDMKNFYTTIDNRNKKQQATRSHPFALLIQCKMQSVKFLSIAKTKISPIKLKSMMTQTNISQTIPIPMNSCIDLCL